MDYMKREICQNCKWLEKPEGVGWCKLLAKYTARKSTCDGFERR